MQKYYLHIQSVLCTIARLNVEIRVSRTMTPTGQPMRCDHKQRSRKIGKRQDKKKHNRCLSITYQMKNIGTKTPTSNPTQRLLYIYVSCVWFCENQPTTQTHSNALPPRFDFERINGPPESDPISLFTCK